MHWTAPLPTVPFPLSTHQKTAEIKKIRDQKQLNCWIADPSGRAGLRPLAYWDWRFESRRRHGCLSLVSVLGCQVEVSARADHLSRGVLPSVVCLSVISELERWEGPGTLGAVELWNKTVTPLSRLEILPCFIFHYCISTYAWNYAFT
jgi:hypothetical protein